MERICTECGGLVSGNARFCPVCGSPMKSAVDLGKQQSDIPAGGLGSGVAGNNANTGNSVGSMSGYGAPQYSNSGIPQIDSSDHRSYNSTGFEFMSTGEWFLTIVVCTFFGIVSLILNIIWGFGSNSCEPRRSYCKAMFFVSIIQNVLGLFLFGLLLGSL